MSSKRLWLIDGHNVIFAVDALRDLQESDRGAEARRRLVDHLKRFAAMRRGNVLIVFDGNELAPNPEARSDPLIEIVYTRRGEGTADDRIIHEARRRAEWHIPVTVVTDDVSTLAVHLPRGVDHVPVRRFWRKHIEKSSESDDKNISGDFSEVERVFLSIAAEEEQMRARAARERRSAIRAPDAAGGIEESSKQQRLDRLREKRERGRRRHARRHQRRRR